MIEECSEQSSKYVAFPIVVSFILNDLDNEEFYQTVLTTIVEEFYREQKEVALDNRLFQMVIKRALVTQSCSLERAIELAQGRRCGFSGGRRGDKSLSQPD